MIALNLFRLSYADYIANTVIVYVIFGLLFIFIIAIYYYQYLSKKENNLKNEINPEKPIFQNLDVLMQEKNIDFF